MSGERTRYRISLAINHEYGAPSAHARTVVRLSPSDLGERQVVSMRLLAVEPPPDERRDGVDFFGNAMTTLAFHRPIDHVALSLRARVERLASPPRLDLSPDLATLAGEVTADTSLDASMPLHFLWRSPRVVADDAITAFASARVGDQRTAIETVEAIGLSLHDAMEFDAEATDVDTPPAAAFAQRHGVCQDFTHIMIAGLRAVGIPAGYVSGFLRTIPPPGQKRLEGADAMHAWVRAWCGTKVGWLEYDPTNACWVGLDHVVVAYGRDYGDVAPVKGSLLTSGPQASEQKVDVEPLAHHPT